MEALAKLEMQSGNAAKAAKLANQLKKDFPKLAQGWLVQYELDMQQKQYAQAAKTMHELMDKGYFTTVTVLNLSRAEWAAGNKTEALDQVKAWLKLHDKDVEAMLYMASAEEAQGHGEAAQKYYENVLAVKPDHPVALNNLAWLLRNKDSARAQDLAEKAVKQHPDSPALADTLAVILMARGEDRRAVQLLQGFVSDGKKDAAPGLRYHYAQALVRTGKKGEAKALLTSLVVEDFPEKVSAQSLLKEISP
jgi:predicted Zn-dependent protease